MKYMNVVRFIVKKEFIKDYKKSFTNQPDWQGNTHNYLIQAGDYSFCAIGIWDSKASMEQEMPNMISWLNQIRHMLEEITPELGVTDPISGEVIFEKK